MGKRIDTEAVDDAIYGYKPTFGDDMAVDGKTLKGAQQEGDRRVHLLTAFLHNIGVQSVQRSFIEHVCLLRQ